MSSVKNVKSGLFWLTIILLSGIFIFLIAGFFRQSKRIGKLQSEKEYLRFENKRLLDYLWDRNYLTTSEISLNLGDDTLLTEMAGIYHLGLWISDKQCSACVDFALNKIKELPDTIQQQVIIFADYQNPRLRKLIQEKIPDQLLIIDYPFSSEGKIFSTTFFAIISSDLEITRVFYPPTELPLLTDHYFSKVIPHLMSTPVSLDHK